MTDTLPPAATPPSRSVDVDAWQRAADRLHADGDDVVERMRVLAARYPGTDGRGRFELAGALDSAGHEAEAAA